MEDFLWMGLRQGGTVGGLEIAYIYIVDLKLYVTIVRFQILYV